MGRKSEQKLSFDNLRGTPVLRELVTKAKLHRQAEQQVLSALPEAMAQGVRFVSYRDGELVLQAESSARASQLRFQQQEIMARLRTHEPFQFVWKVTVKVAPARVRDKPKPRKQPLSKENARLLREEAGHTKDKALREVLEKLASHVQD